MERDKLIHELFIGKVVGVIGLNKTIELLKESKYTIDNVLTDKEPISNTEPPLSSYTKFS